MEIKISYMEIYNECINDLLDKTKADMALSNCEPVGLTATKCHSFEQAMGQL